MSRVVTADELARNTGRIPADGLCGYLALQWAASGAEYAPEWAELRVVENRERLCRFLGRLLVGCRSERVRSKLELVMVSLRYASAPWRLSRDSAGWLDVGDLAHLAIDFPLVIWGRDMGGGNRRVRYPVSGNAPLTKFEAVHLSSSEGQLVLDSEHFFPLDGVLLSEGADVVMGLACGEQSGIPIGTVDLSGESVGQGSPAGRVAEALGARLGKQARVEELSVVKQRAWKVARGDSRPSSVVEDSVLVPAEAREGEVLDLTVDEVAVRRYGDGRWSAVAARDGFAVLSRVVTTGELARNTGRIPAEGLCGYLALQWAAAGAEYAPEWAELRVVENRERLCRLLSRLLVGCRSERVRLKLERVMVSLRYAPVPWSLSSADWLDIGDLAHLAIDFSLVVWGRDMGGGTGGYGTR